MSSDDLASAPGGEGRCPAILPRNGRDGSGLSAGSSVATPAVSPAALTFPGYRS